MESLPDRKLILISPSRLGTYHLCPKKADFIYNRQLLPTGPSKGYFNKGNYFHELAHVYYQFIHAGAEPGSEYAVKYMLTKIEQDLSRMEDSSLIPVFGVISNRMIRYIREQSSLIDNKIDIKGVEREIVYPIDEGIALRGFADLVYRDRRGVLHIRDHKTGQKAWTKADAQMSEQLLIYSTILWKISGDLPIAEINYINTKEYIKKQPTTEECFTFASVSYTEKELSIFFDTVCKEIVEMLQSSPTPHYTQQCKYCPYMVPCFAERKGIDSTPILQASFKFEPREGIMKHARFTEDDSSLDDFN